jgi:hypothetical protein
MAAEMSSVGTKHFVATDFKQLIRDVRQKVVEQKPSPTRRSIRRHEQGKKYTRYFVLHLYRREVQKARQQGDQQNAQRLC